MCKVPRDHIPKMGYSSISSKETTAHRTDVRKGENMQQSFTSAATSINCSKLPVIYKKAVEMIQGRKVIDVGGGRFDNGIEYGATIGAAVTVYDPYNRTAEHNAAALAGRYDVALCSNVLNVIDSKEARRETLQICRSHAAETIITVYEGNGSGQGRQTGRDQWQENRRLADYIPECMEVFESVQMTRGMLVCR